MEVRHLSFEPFGQEGKLTACLARQAYGNVKESAAVQGFVAGQQSSREASHLPIPMASCTGLHNNLFPLGTALQGVAVCVCDGSGRFLPPDIPGYLYLGSAQTAAYNIATGLRVAYGWDGLLTLLTSQVDLTSISLCNSIAVPFY